jgi:hypothetical protein
MTAVTERRHPHIQGIRGVPIPDTLSLSDSPAGLPEIPTAASMRSQTSTNTGSQLVKAFFMHGPSSAMNIRLTLLVSEEG